MTATSVSAISSDNSAFIGNVVPGEHDRAALGTLGMITAIFRSVARLNDAAIVNIHRGHRNIRTFLTV